MQHIALSHQGLMCITAALLQSKAVAEHVGVLLDADEKFLIFSHHTDMHNAVEAAVRG